VIRTSCRGVTLIEVLVVVAVLGSVLAIMSGGTNLLNAFLHQWSWVENQRQAQLQLYSVTKDIRNSIEIVNVSSMTSTLVLRTYDFRRSYDSADAANIFNVEPGTITYQYSGLTSTDTYLSRSTQFPGDPQYTKRLLRNLLLPPGTAYAMFSPYPVGATAPYDAVEVTLVMGRGFLSASPRRYEAIALKRSREN
jgi:prepilin-type N-terminal cleavage/methylation domain-containing protein